MPIYEYRCGRCEKTFETVQSVHVRIEDTVCPFCQAQEATRLISSVASKVVGSHKTGFSEMKAYNMLSERVNSFSKLPPVFGARTAPPSVEDLFSASESSSTAPPKKSET
jgi:putative FmdB family regulatory protein